MRIYTETEDFCVRCNAHEDKSFDSRDMCAECTFIIPLIIYVTI